ncbi:MAG: DUF2924 domain-containing protein [Alphaproteobacteria bacterium]
MPCKIVMNGGRSHPASADLSAQLAALKHLDAASLRAEWRRLYRSHPPQHIRRDLLVLAIAWKLQERVLGGLTDAQKRRLAGLAEELRKNGDLSGSPSIRVKPGSRLVREWQGETHEVLVLEDGFEWNGQRCRSLSAIAREITGARWSGPRFFGLQRKAKPYGRQECADA